MTKVLSKLGARALSLTEPHNEFLELCAVSTSGQLTEEEQKKLQEHLAVCNSCRETLKQYESIVGHAIPVFVPRKRRRVRMEARIGRKISNGRQSKPSSNALESTNRGEAEKSARTSEVSTIPRRLPPFSSESTWRHVCMLYAAGILLFVSLGFYAYRAGVHRGIDTSKVTAPLPNAQSQATLAAQSSDAGHERQIARTQIEQRDKTIGDLRRQLAQDMAEINTLKAAQDRLDNDLRASDAGKHDLNEQRSELAQKLDAALSASQGLQQKLDSLAQQSAQDTARAKTLDAKVDGLNRLLRDREVALDQKDELLAHDRDIRDLMGARDLYIAEVYDIARTGETLKPLRSGVLHAWKVPDLLRL
jgi:hypothetical protein